MCKVLASPDGRESSHPSHQRPIFYPHSLPIIFLLLLFKVVMVKNHLNLATLLSPSPPPLAEIHTFIWINDSSPSLTPSIHSMDSIPLTYLSNSLPLRPSPPSRLLGGSKFYEPSNRSLIQFTTTKEYRTQRCRLVATSLKGWFVRRKRFAARVLGSLDYAMR